jgi:hypothetical protein
VEEVEILNDESVVAFGFARTSFWILNGRGREEETPQLRLASRLGVPGLLERSSGTIRKSLTSSEFLFEWKTSVEISPLGETERLSEIPVHKLMKSWFSCNRENSGNVKIGLLFTKNSLFTTT